VIYTGLHQTPERVVEAAIQEDVNVIGISLLSGAHMTIFPAVMKLLRENEASDIMVIGGGIIPEEDAIRLKDGGVAALFGPGTPIDDIVKFINDNSVSRNLPEAGPDGDSR